MSNEFDQNMNAIISSYRDKIIVLESQLDELHNKFEKLNDRHQQFHNKKVKILELMNENQTYSTPKFNDRFDH